MHYRPHSITPCMDNKMKITDTMKFRNPLIAEQVKIIITWTGENDENTMKIAFKIIEIEQYLNKEIQEFWKGGQNEMLQM